MAAMPAATGARTTRGVRPCSSTPHRWPSPACWPRRHFQLSLAHGRASGDVGENIQPGNGKHLIWDAGTDCPGLVSNNMRARIYAHDGRHSAEVCFVPAGSFVTSTGAPVFLSSYYIDKYEVTNLLYCVFLNSGGHDNRWHQEMINEIGRAGEAGDYVYQPRPGYENRPVRYVSWYDGKAFCDWRSSQEGLSSGSYHLPTEAQWEKAAGWDPVEEKLWSYAIQSNSISCNTVNYNNCAGRTTDVGSYEGHDSYYGCYDMSGNVYEWCADWYDSDGYPSSTSNPSGPGSGTYRVLRGGGWSYSASSVQVGNRYRYAPTGVHSGGGFRCARTLE